MPLWLWQRPSTLWRCVHCPLHPSLLCPLERPLLYTRATPFADQQPCNTGIGGDVFALVYSPVTKRVHAVNGSGRAPKALTLAKARELGLSGLRIPNDSVHAGTVPGSAAAWVDLHEKFGSKKLSLGEIFEVRRVSPTLPDSLSRATQVMSCLDLTPSPPSG
jgi:hypothetical protein